jgi:omega-6 fatty acid desaturase (delta-12 desaturase)
MGQHYRADTKTPFMTAFWKNQRECKFVEESVDGSGIYFFRNLYGKGTPAKKLCDESETQLKREAAEIRETDVDVPANTIEIESPRALSSAISSKGAEKAKRRFSQTGRKALPLLADVLA